MQATKTSTERSSVDAGQQHGHPKRIGCGVVVFLLTAIQASKVRDGVLSATRRRRAMQFATFDDAFVQMLAARDPQMVNAARNLERVLAAFAATFGAGESEVQTCTGVPMPVRAVAG